MPGQPSTSPSPRPTANIGPVDPPLEVNVGCGGTWEKVRGGWFFLAGSLAQDTNHRQEDSESRRWWDECPGARTLCQEVAFIDSQYIMDGVLTTQGLSYISSSHPRAADVISGACVRPPGGEREM